MIRTFFIITALIIGAVFVISQFSTIYAQPGDKDTMEQTNLQTATFGAGCFWGVEASFRKVDGVVETAVGYSGGTKENPTYQEVCTDRTGHAEVVRVQFDPSKVTFEELLKIFWDSHDPTTLNRQGPDVGRQYRSAVFYHNEAQREIAESAKEQLGKSGTYQRPVVTEITPASTFYQAEEYHQRYLEKQGKGSCRL